MAKGYCAVCNQLVDIVPGTIKPTCIVDELVPRLCYYPLPHMMPVTDANEDGDTYTIWIKCKGDKVPI